MTDFVILQPMMIPTSSLGLENMFRAKLLHGHLPADTYEFSILSKPQDAAWTVHATGRFTVRYKKAEDEQARGEQAEDEHTEESEADSYRRSYETARRSCDVDLIPRQFYERLDGIGISYGPLFRNIVELSQSSSSSYSCGARPNPRYEGQDALQVRVRPHNPPGNAGHHVAGRHRRGR